MERKNKELIELQEKTKQCRESRKQSEFIMQAAMGSLQKLYMNLCPTAIIPKEPQVMLEHIRRESKKLIESYKKHMEAENLRNKVEMFEISFVHIKKDFTRLQNYFTEILIKFHYN